MNKIIDTKPIMERLKEEYKSEVAMLKTKPKFTVVSVGDVAANNVYVAKKLQHCNDVGIETKHVALSRLTTQTELMNVIVNEQMNCDSIILQLPLDCVSDINVNKALDIIEPCKDVDGLSLINQGKLFTGNPFLAPATPLACMKLLNEIDYNVDGKSVLVIGRSQLLGKSLAQLLEQANATVTLAHSHSKHLDGSITWLYDVVISCVGIPHKFKHINADVIIDCGISFKDGRMLGDIDIDTCEFDYATTTPNRDKGIKGGIGSLTVCCLIENIIKSHRLQGGN